MTSSLRPTPIVLPRPGSFSFGLAYRNNLSLEIGDIQVVDRIESSKFISHLDKAEFPGFAGLMIADDTGRDDFTKFRKQLYQIFGGGFRTEVTHK